MSNTISNRETAVQLAGEHGIRPARCQCGHAGNFGRVTSDEDPYSGAIWQCNECGSYTWRSRKAILAAIRRKREFPLRNYG